MFRGCLGCRVGWVTELVGLQSWLGYRVGWVTELVGLQSWLGCGLRWVAQVGCSGGLSEMVDQSRASVL